MKSMDFSLTTRRVGLICAFIIVLFLNSPVYAGWATMTPPSVSAQWYLSGVHLTSPSEAWAVGGDDSNHRGVLLHYSGGTWTNVSAPSVSADWGVYSVYFTSPSQGWAVGNDNSNQRGVLLHDVDGTWTSVSPPTVSTRWGLGSVHFTSPNEGWAVGSDGLNHKGVLLHYSGGTWTSVSPPSVSASWELNAVHFTSPGEGWAVGADISNERGVLLHYSGGVWTFVNPPAVSANWVVYAVHFTSSGEGWAVGVDGTIGKAVLLHHSGGVWTSVPPPGNSYLSGVYFTSPSEGWAVGQANRQGVLLGYSGGTWASVSPPAFSAEWFLGGVHFISSDDGWAVGWDDHRGVLLHFVSPIVVPDEGTTGTEFTITGSGFGAKKGKVLLGTTSLKILEWTDESIQCQLTRALSPGAYDITIKPQARGSSPITISNGFTIEAPEIDSVNPTSGSTGDEITMKGLHFGTKRGKVTLGGKNCRVLSWTMDPLTEESEIQFTVPGGLFTGTKELKVTNGVGVDTRDFTIE